MVFLDVPQGGAGPLPLDRRSVKSLVCYDIAAAQLRDLLPYFLCSCHSPALSCLDLGGQGDGSDSRQGDQGSIVAHDSAQSARRGKDCHRANRNEGR